jgi:hypothetical protein
VRRKTCYIEPTRFSRFGIRNLGLDLPPKRKKPFELLDVEACLMRRHACTMDNEFLVVRYPSALLRLGFLEMLFNGVVKDRSVMEQDSLAELIEAAYLTLCLFRECLGFGCTINTMTTAIVYLPQTK